MLPLCSAELHGAFGWSTRSPPPRGAHALSVSRGEKKREREEEEEGKGNNDISLLFSPPKSEMNILIGAVSASIFCKKQSVFQQI